MNINQVKRMQDEKDHLMRFEGKHPANRNEADIQKYGHKEHDRRFKSKTEMLAEDLVKDAEKEGLHMEIE